MSMNMRWDRTLDHLLINRRWCDDIRNYIATQQNNARNDPDDIDDNDVDDDDDYDDADNRQ